MAKISRNDKCPCGSGLKYKKCCMNKVSVENNYFRALTNNELKDPIIDRKLVEILKAVFKEYNYFELTRAVFCMNSWRGNRPELAFYLSLNAAVVECDKNGKKMIETFAQLKDFYLKIKKQYAYSFLVDENIPDFGDVVIDFKGEFFPVFVGTGHNHIFSLMQSIPTIAWFLKKEEEFFQLLKHVKTMIDALSENNPYEQDKSFGDWFLPSEKHFISCCMYYKPFSNEQFKLNFEEMISFDELYNLNIHFVFYDEKIYSLFDPGIIVTYFELLIRNLSEEEKGKLAENCLYFAIEKNYGIEPNSKKLFYPVGIFEDDERAKLVDDYCGGILLLGGGKALFFVNENPCSNFNYDKYIGKINKISDGDKVEFVELSQSGKTRVVQTKRISSYKALTYNNRLNINEFSIMTLGKEDMYRKAVLDIIYILYASDSIEEMFDFYNSEDQNAFQIIGNDGDSALFDAWKSQYGQIERGAKKIGLLSTGLNMPEWNMFHKYRELKNYYPFANYSKMFSNPNVWKVTDEENGMYHLSNKAVDGFGGSYRKVGDSNLFIAYNLTFEKGIKFNKNEQECYRFIYDLLNRLFITYESVLVESGFYDVEGVQIMFMPQEYAKNVGLKIKNINNYVSSDYFFAGQRLLIRYCVNLEKFFKDLSIALTKEVECNFMIELLQCLECTWFDYARIKNAIEKDRGSKKDISVKFEKMNYYFSNKNIVLEIENKFFVRAKKEIAQCCLDAGIMPGEYVGKEASVIVRKIQQLLIPLFEKNIIKYNKIDLHNKLLSKLAYYTHEKRANGRRYSLINDTNLSNEARHVTEKNARDLRENNKLQIKNILFLIETNLSMERDVEKKIDDDAMSFISAFADWLIVLQDNSDLSYKELNFVKIVVDKDYVVDTVIIEDDPENTQIRTYANKDYVPDFSFSPITIDNVLFAFQQDTGFLMKDILLICHYLRYEFTYTFMKNEVLPDVFIVNKNEIIDDLFSKLIQENRSESMKIRLSNALDFLIIEYDKIKYLNRRECEFIPIWEREQRNNRFDMKPIVSIKNDIIFSPVIINELLNIWTNGFSELYLPYEIGLTKTCEVISKWKEYHEQQMEKDIAKIFSQKQNFEVLHSFVFNKRDKVGNHPQELGDYDVIAVNRITKEIWNIESKNLHKVGSVSEFFNQQKGFFLQNKYDEKFQRRIDYLENHVNDLLRILGISDDSNKYIIHNYMVTNKVFAPIVKKIKFQIITFDELSKMIEKKYK